MRIAIALGALTLAACSAPPEEVVAELARALEARDSEAALALVHPDYADPRGDRAALAADLRALPEAFSRIRLDYQDLSTVEGASAREVTATGTLDAELVGDTTWRVVGPAQLELLRDDGFKVRAGLLPHLRDIRDLMRRRQAALEANDAEALRPLLHPRYRDGDADLQETMARLARDLVGAPVRLRVTNYRLELRGPTAHLDEHYVLTVAGQTLPPRIARFTLAPSAGRWRILAGLYPEVGTTSPTLEYRPRSN
ncbi:MAG: hypothetical protein KC933_10120 [Myxococcales bacterium]|nr:hypothetical protein [Myxococcales bacterium]